MSFVYFQIMEYLIGGDLKSLLIMVGFFPEHMACFYAAEIIQALEFLHKQGIVHRFFFLYVDIIC